MADDTDEASAADAVVDNPFDEPLPPTGTLYFDYLKNCPVGARMGLRLDAHDSEVEFIVLKAEADKWLVPTELTALVNMESPFSNLELLLAVRMAVDNEQGITVLHGKLDMKVKKELARKADTVTESGCPEAEECDIVFHTVSDVIDLDDYHFSPEGSN
eukprot:2272279-Pleurochrysis_carterae.AAC.1